MTNVLVLAFMALCLSPLFILAKDAPASGKPEKIERKVEMKGGRITEKVKDAKRSKGTNEVWITGREFKTMFARRPASAKKGKGK